MTPEREPAPARDDARWKNYAFAVVPLVGLVELFAHLHQVNAVVPEADWLAARAAAASLVKPADLVMVAPWWADPLGREYLGEGLLTVEREARPDVTRFPRAIEVSLRGKHAPELVGWRTVGEQKVGAITVFLRENPSPVTLRDDLLAHVDDHRIVVERVDGAKVSACPRMNAPLQAGGLGSGPAIPPARFQCSGASVALTVLNAIGSTPHRCLLAPPLGGDAILRVRFEGVVFGSVLHGHAGLQSEAERNETGAPVTLTFRALHDGERSIGQLVHHDGEGWKGFEFPTAELAGQTGTLIADVQASNGQRRLYCFEADTR